MGALSLALALPLSFNVSAASADNAADSAAARASYGSRSASMPGQWRNYALASITPAFSWAVRPSPARSVPDVLDRYGAGSDTRALLNLDAQPQSRLTVSFASGLVSDTPAPGRVAAGVSLVPSGPGIERSIIAPSLTYAVGNTGSVSVSALFARQRFATLGMGLADADYLPPSALLLGNESAGAGGRLDFGAALGNRWRWTAGYQSRINMDAFRNYRGVFSEPGKFDIPANANIGLQYAITPAIGVDVGIDRVMYSNVAPFTSLALPTRLLALLGDGASPEFRWNDLTVYSVGWTLRSRTFGEFALRYSTGQQPEPTSELLARALSEDRANRTVSLGWSRALSEDTHFGFLASYASSPYYLGVPSYRELKDGNAQQMEFQAYWLTRF